MQIEPVNNTNFKAGKIRLKNLDAVELPNQKVLEKLALDNEIDFLISKHKKNKNLLGDIYTVTAITNKAKQKRGIDKFVMPFKVCVEEACVLIYNSAVRALEFLHKEPKTF